MDLIKELEQFKKKVNGNSHLGCGDLDAFRYTKHEVINEAIRIIEKKLK